MSELVDFRGWKWSAQEILDAFLRPPSFTQEEWEEFLNSLTPKQYAELVGSVLAKLHGTVFEFTPLPM